MIGQTISHYRIEEKLGEGGMGVVYRARDLSLNRSVAIKFLSVEVADLERRRRFQLEAQAASALNHPHILTVFEAGESDGRQYLVTEFIDGPNLREWAPTQQTVKRILDLLVGIADALATAHQAGIVHRDIKPENILVSKAGYAKLVDFGLAKLMPAEKTPESEATVSGGATRPGTILGTVAYMSPEQAAGSPVDARSDIFAFGVVLYELLTGRRPFTGESDLVVLKAIIHSRPQSLSELRPDLPSELRMIVDKGLEKDPGDRYQSMREMVVDLRRAQRLEASSTVSVLAQGPEVAPGRRRRWWIAATIAAGLAVSLALTGWLLRRSGYWPQNPLANAQYTRLTDFEGNEEDAAISPDGKLVAFLADRQGPADVWVTHLGTGEFVNLTKGRFDRVGSAGVERVIGFSGDGAQICVRVPDGKGGENTWLAPTMGGEPRLLFPNAASAVFSPDGSRIVYHEVAPGDRTVVVERNGSNPKQIFRDKPEIHAHYQSWSPDGRFIYFSRGNLAVSEMDIWRIPSAGGEPERITRHNSRVAYPTLLDNRTLIYCATAEDGSGPWLYWTDVERRVAARASSGVERYLSVSASAGAEGRARRLVAAVSNPTANLWAVPITGEVADESAVQPFQVGTARALAPRFGPDYLLYLSSRTGVDGLWRFKNGSARELWKGSDGPLNDSAALSPDGRRVCFSVRRRGRTVLHLMTPDGTEVRPLAESLDVRGAASWSPDSSRLVVVANDGKGLGLFQVPLEGGAPARLLDKPSFHPAWSPDGRFIVYSEAAGGTSLRVRALTPEGAPYPLPELTVRTGGDRYRFLPNGQGLVLWRVTQAQQQFWLMESASGRLRQLTSLRQGFIMRGFDISPDGKQIVFDRLRENADIVLIELQR